MTSRDLDRLAKHVKAHRLELYSSRLAAAQAAGISKDTWHRVEEGLDVRESTYAKIDRALGWVTGSCILIAEGGTPVLGDTPPADADGAPAATLPSAETVRKAAFEAARAKMPASTPIGAIDAFAEEIVEILRRAGGVAEDS